MRQSIQPAAGSTILFRYADGRPAILRARIGNGVADYASTSLQNAGYARLLDVLANQARVSRPLRVRLNGPAQQQVEVRFARQGDRRLMYLFNSNAQPIHAHVETSDSHLASLTELRSGQSIRGGDLTVAPHQTNIYELF